MALFDTKYPNTSRVVSGTPQLYNDDVILLCDTSTGPITINLLEIPAGSWNVNWKLHVIDGADKASINNITIIPPVGSTINTLANVVVNTNGGGALIRIGSDTSFVSTSYFVATGGGAGVMSVTGVNTDNTDPINPIVRIAVDNITISGNGASLTPLYATGKEPISATDTTADYLSNKLVAGANMTLTTLNPGANEQIQLNALGSVGYDQINDEGVGLPQRQTIDFVGSLVTATDVGAQTRVTINPNPVQISNANLVALALAGNLVPGTDYEITDPQYAESIFVQAINNSQIDLEGTARVMYADYQLNGDYSGVAGFNSALGLYLQSMAPVVGDVVIYNNIHWENTTGVNTGVVPPLDLVNWSQLAVSLTNGYKENVEDVLYNPAQNRPDIRRDKRGNEVRYADPKGDVNYLDFPWGNSAFTDNLVYGAESRAINLLNVPLAGAGLGFANNVISDGIMSFIGITTLTGGALSCYGNYVGLGGKLGIENSNLASFNINGNYTNGVCLVSNYAIAGAVVLSNNKVDYSCSLLIGNSLGAGTITGNSQIYCKSNRVIGENADLGFDSIVATGFDAYIEGNIVDSVRWNITTFTSSATCRCSDNKLSPFEPLSGVIIQFNTTVLNDNSLQGGYGTILNTNSSTFRKVIDMNDPLQYDTVLQTIYLGTEQHIGEYLIINGTGQTFSIIDDGNPDGLPFKLIANGPVAGIQFRMLATAIAGATGNQVISNASQTYTSQHDFYPDTPESTTLYRGKAGATGNLFVIKQEVWN